MTRSASFATRDDRCGRNRARAVNYGSWSVRAHVTITWLAFSLQASTTFDMARSSSSRIATRKRPKQERSEALVDAIVAAAAEEFVTKGYEQATTNRIAAAAGVSVGSLYQYFPSKQAIAVELMRRYRAARIEVVRAKLAPLPERPLGEVVRSLLEALFHDDAIERELLAVLIQRVVWTEAHTEFRGYEDKLTEIVADAIRRGGGRVDDFDRAAYFLVRTIQALIHAAVAEDRRYDVATMVDEGTKLVMRYLNVAE
jgi:AcrR family transcriptional regulator